MNTKYIWTDPDRCGGRPCLRGHRLTVAQLLQEMVDYSGHNKIAAVAGQFGLPIEDLRGMVQDVIQHFDQKFEV